MRSRNYLSPFPEEFVRVAVMRMAHVLYAPDRDAMANLRELRVGGIPIDIRPAQTSNTA